MRALHKFGGTDIVINSVSVIPLQALPITPVYDYGWCQSVPVDCVMGGASTEYISTCGLHYGWCQYISR